MTTTALAHVAKPATQAIQQYRLSDETMQILRDSMMKGASAAEVMGFKLVAEKMQLDPIAKQIHAVKRWDSKEGRHVWTFQTSIDGYRLIAQRTSEYEGQTPPQWCDEDGVWKDVWLSKKPPAAAKVGVHRKGFREPLVAIATFDQYVQTYYDEKKKEHVVNNMWTKMPANQLAKCAEALALRKAFPQELSGAYVDEEMGQADLDAGPDQREPAREAMQDTTVVNKRATGLDYMNAVSTWTGYKGGDAKLKNACAEFSHATGVVKKGQKPTLQQYALLIELVDANKHRPFDEAIQQVIDPRATQGAGAGPEDDNQAKPEDDFVA